VTARRVVVATRNKGKLVEIRTALGFLGWEFVTAEDLGADLEVEETGETFLENALLKAEAYRDEFGIAALADDSGLQVDALDGQPGVWSSRFAGEDADDDANNRLLLERLDGIPDRDRTARFRSVIVLIEPDGSVTTANGVCEGSIANVPVGEGGFGYDPLFLPVDAPGRSMAELRMEEKNAISHRGAALRDLHSQLEKRSV